jgi:hypothetical protein
LIRKTIQAASPIGGAAFLVAPIGSLPRAAVQAAGAADTLRLIPGVPGRHAVSLGLPSCPVKRLVACMQWIDETMRDIETTKL